MQNSIHLTAELNAQIRDEGRQGYPYEICGVMVGELRGHTKVVTTLYPQVNERTDSAENRFLISADLIKDAQFKAIKAGLDIMGFYHSHPDHPAIASKFDTDHAWPWYSYIIVSIEKGKDVDMRSWVLDDNRERMHEEPVEVG